MRLLTQHFQGCPNLKNIQNLTTNYLHSYTTNAKLCLKKQVKEIEQPWISDDPMFQVQILMKLINVTHQFPTFFGK